MSITTPHAQKIVEAIIEDLTNRKGLRQEWDQIDDDIQREIKTIWTHIARETKP